MCFGGFWCLGVYGGGGCMGGGGMGMGFCWSVVYL